MTSIEIHATPEGLTVGLPSYRHVAVYWGWRWAYALAAVALSLLLGLGALWWAISLDLSWSQAYTKLDRKYAVEKAEWLAREGCWRQAYAKKVVGSWVDGWVAQCVKGRKP